MADRRDPRFIDAPGTGSGGHPPDGAKLGWLMGELWGGFWSDDDEDAFREAIKDELAYIGEPDAPIEIVEL